MVRFGGSLSIEVWIDVHDCGRMGMVFLKVPGEYLDQGGNCAQKEFYWVRHGGLIVGINSLELLHEFL